MKTKTRTTSNPERQQRALFYFSTEQGRLMRTLAKRHNTSQAHIVRLGIDLAIAKLSRTTTQEK